MAGTRAEKIYLDERMDPQAQLLASSVVVHEMVHYLRVVRNGGVPQRVRRTVNYSPAQMPSPWSAKLMACNGSCTAMACINLWGFPCWAWAATVTIIKLRGDLRALVNLADKA
jgi:hypothetical protein